MRSAPTSSRNSKQSNGQLRYGYESKGLDRPSVQILRGDFLSLLLKLRPQLVLKLFNIGKSPLETLISSQERAIRVAAEQIAVRVRHTILDQSSYIRASAIKQVIPSWRSLSIIDGADDLRREMTVFAKEQNLESEWYLDDMLDFLRRFNAAKDKVLANALRADGDGYFLKQVIFRCWQETVHERRYSGLVNQFTSNILVEEAGAFTFSFVYEEIELKVSGPFNKTWKQFEHDVDREFRNAGGPLVRGARKQLKLKLQDYRERVEQLAIDMDLVKAPVMWAVDQHLEWLIQFQVPPCNAYKRTAVIYEKDERTIREGVAVVARLIDLPLRQSRAGRPTGVKETVPRRRTIRR